LRGKKVLYLRAKKIIYDISSKLNSLGVDCDEAIVYETKCTKYVDKYKFNKGSIFIFTSPSTIDCFFDNFTWDNSYSAIVIGKTTLSYLPKHIKNVFLSNDKSIQSCIDIAKSL
jgi:uroporphyrinogen-III synthase